MTCSCEDLRYRRWNPNTGRCETCSGYYVDGIRVEPRRAVASPIPEIETSPGTVSDLRMSLRETFLDYARQATETQAYFEAGIWLKAADITSAFVTKRQVKL